MLVKFISDPSLGGVFRNDRLYRNPDQSHLAGWGVTFYKKKHSLVLRCRKINDTSVR